jgi:hypothetical protein
MQPRLRAHTCACPLQQHARCIPHCARSPCPRHPLSRTPTPRPPPTPVLYMAYTLCADSASSIPAPSIQSTSPILLAPPLGPSTSSALHSPPHPPCTFLHPYPTVSTVSHTHLACLPCTFLHAYPLACLHPPCTCLPPCRTSPPPCRTSHRLLPLQPSSSPPALHCDRLVAAPTPDPA